MSEGLNSGGCNCFFFPKTYAKYLYSFSLSIYSTLENGNIEVIR